MKNEKKGFTLVEIIVCISLLTIISLSSIVLLKKNINKTQTDITKNEKIISAIDVFENTKKVVKSPSILNGAISNAFYCLKKESLIDSGVIKQDEEVFKNISNDKYIKVSENDLGEKSYEIASKEECSYIESNIDNKEIDETTKEIQSPEDGSYSGNYTIKSNTDDKNLYTLNMNFNARTASIAQVSKSFNIYTIFIVDGSGSMGSRGFSTVKNAAKNLSSTLTNDNNNNSTKNYVSAISFSSRVDKEIDFKTSMLLDNDFSYGQGRTNYYSAFFSAYNKIRNVGVTDNRFFIIFLSDGKNNGGNYTTQLNNIRNKIEIDDQEYGKIITVGFNYNNNTLRDISSDGCSTSNNKCYYTTNSSNISDVYNDFKTVMEESLLNEYKESNIVINLGENFKTDNGEDKFEIKQTLLATNQNETQFQTLLDNKDFNIKFNNISYNGSDIKDELSIIKNIEIELIHSSDSNKNQKIDIDTSNIKIKFNIEKKYAIN